MRLLFLISEFIFLNVSLVQVLRELFGILAYSSSDGLAVILRAEVHVGRDLGCKVARMNYGKVLLSFEAV